MWDLVERCGSQIKTAGLGSIIGFDHAAFFQMAKHLGYDLRAIAILLPSIESALIEAIKDISDKDQQDDGYSQCDDSVIG